MKNDLTNYQELQEKLKNSVKDTIIAENPWERVKLSLGTAICEDAMSSSLSEQLVIAENNMLKDRHDLE